MRCPHCGKEIPEEKQQNPSMQILGGLRVMVSPFWKSGSVLVSSDDWNRAVGEELEKMAGRIKGILDIEEPKP